MLINMQNLEYWNSNAPLEAGDKILFGFLGFIAISSIFLLVLMARQFIQEDRDLNQWRKKLYRNDKVRVVGMKGPQIIYINKLNGTVVLKVDNNSQTPFITVPVENVYPLNE